MSDTTQGAQPTPQSSPGGSGTPAGGRRRRRVLVWMAIAAVALVAITGSLVYTERSSFCPACHEMRPYYEAWAAGGHSRSAQCVDCHVDSGVVAHLAHKPIALKEVWDHFFADNRFPNFSVDVPNSRCTGCHPNVPNKPGSLFSHAVHVGRVTCKDCHAQTGHVVSLASLQAEGVLRSNPTTTPVSPGATPTSLPGHVTVICQDCHDLAKMKCSSCHQAPHDNRGECSNCHRPGSRFYALHPAGTDCAACHTPPANHFGPDCSGCHTPGTPFAQAVFNHPTNTGDHTFRSFPCVKCHPNGLATAVCTCHGGSAPTGD
jgi:nitrate/TMAO reductase-like tetraheme cytochrome c subunit